MRRIIFLFIGVFIYLQTTAQITITGTVTDIYGDVPLPGAGVRLKGNADISTITDLIGGYSIEVPADATTLVFTYVGMETQEVEISGRTVIDIQMNSIDNNVDEVIVIAYGNAKKSSFTGSATDINAEDLERIPPESITKALDGLSTGLQVINPSGQPGENAIIHIRGIGSVNAASEPLYVVDGFPYGGNINTIHPSDIESLTILKDASATSLYGSRAANGIIIITTKKGVNNTSNFEVKYNIGITERAIPEYDRLGVDKTYEMNWERLYNNNLDAGETDADARILASEGLINAIGGYNIYKNITDDNVINPNTGKVTGGTYKWTDDWQKELFNKTAIHHDIALSANGGSDKSRYFVSGNYLNSEGIISTSNFKRFSGRINVESQVKKWAKVALGITGSTQTQNYPDSSDPSYTNSFFWTRNIAPYYPVYSYDLDGNIQFSADGNKKFDYGNEFNRNRVFSSNSNPLGVVSLDKRVIKRDIVSARGSIELKFLKNFSFTVSGSTDYYGYSALTHQNSLHGDAETFRGRSMRTTSRTITSTFNEILRWHKSFNKHTINLLAGHESYSLTSNVLYATKSGFPFVGVSELIAASTNEGTSSYEDKLRIESYFSDFKYDFDDKYFLAFSFRTDGSSRFHPNTRWGNFWSVGASWIITNERFMDEINWLNELRIKGSYGQQGNDRLGTYYAYPAFFELGHNNINRPGTIAQRLATPELKWEKSNILNIGFHTKLLNRFALGFEYFERESQDLLFEQPLPLSTGFEKYDANIGSIKNTGIEIDFNATIIKNTSFRWDFGFNLTHYKNRFTELPQKEIIAGNKKYMVGHSINDYFIKEFAGVDPETGESLWYTDEQKVDENNQPVFDAEGKPVFTGSKIATNDYNLATNYYAGSRMPDYTGAVQSTLSLFNFDFHVLATYSKGGKIYDYVYAGLMDDGFGEAMHADILNRWTPDNPNTNVPKLNGDQNMAAESTRFLIDASYIAINNISLGYTFPQELAKRIYINDLRLYVSADNLWVFSGKKGLDPRQFFDGNSTDVYSPVRIISFGIDLKF